MNVLKSRWNSLKSWWLKVWRNRDGEWVLFSICIWLLIEAELCLWHKDLQDYVGPFVEASLLIAQLVAVFLIFVLALIFDWHERIQAAAKNASAALAVGVTAGLTSAPSQPPAPPTQGPGPQPPAPAASPSPAPATAAQSDRLLTMIAHEIPRVPIFFGAAALISAASGAARAAISAHASGGWGHVFRPSLTPLCGAVFLFGFATLLRGFSWARFAFVLALGTVFMLTLM